MHGERILLLFLIVVSGAARASSELTLEDLKPGSASHQLLPALELQFGYDDNLTHSNIERQSSAYSQLSIAGSKRVGSPLTFLKAGYGVSANYYSSSSADNTLDLQLDLQGSHEFTSRHRIALNIEYLNSHERRGEGLSQGLGDELEEPLEFDTSVVGFEYQLGAKSSKLTTRILASLMRKEYTNQEELTQYRDFDGANLGVIFNYQVLPKTHWLIQLSQKSTEYHTANLSAGSLDNQLYRFLTGIHWDISGKTKGHLKLGVEQKEFEQKSKKGQTSTTWEVGADWLLRSYSIVSIRTSKGLREAGLQGDFTESQAGELSWRHQWQQRFFTRLNVARLDEAFKGANQQNQKQLAKLSAEYQLTNKIKLQAAYQYVEVDSTVVNYQYDKNLVSISFSVGN